MERIVERVCGIDVHKATLSACVRVSSAQADIEQEVRSFGTTGDELLELRQWLQSFGVTQVAMEATGVYWKPVYYVLEEAFSMVLVNPAEVKQLPGRKTDVADCAWLAQLLEHGLLRSSFVPPPAIRELRDLVRYRGGLKGDHARLANRLHKVLQDADLKLSGVVGNVLGVSGRRILQQLAAHNTDPSGTGGTGQRTLAHQAPATAPGTGGPLSARIMPSCSAGCWPISTMSEESCWRSASGSRNASPLSHRRLNACAPSPASGTVSPPPLSSPKSAPSLSCFPSAAHLASSAGICPGNNRDGASATGAKASNGNR